MKRDAELFYLLATILPGTCLCVAYQNWGALFFCINSIVFQFGMYWWRKRAWNLEQTCQQHRESEK